MSLFLALCLACTHGKPAEEPAATPEVAATPVSELPSRPEREEVAPTEVPPEHLTVRGLLLSRDGFIRPGRDVLDVHEGAWHALVWLAVSDDMLMVRERALLTLALYPDAPTAEVCAGHLDAEHAKVRAGAVRCLAGQDLAASEALRLSLEQALLDEDVRPGIAAAEVLAPVESARPALERALGDEAVPEATRTRIDELLQ